MLKDWLVLIILVSTYIFTFKLLVSDKISSYIMIKLVIAFSAFLLVWFNIANRKVDSIHIYLWVADTGMAVGILVSDIHNRIHHKEKQ